MKIEINVDIPAGYEATGEYKVPGSGEYFLTLGGQVYMHRHADIDTGEGVSTPRIILKKSVAWIDACLPRDWGKAARFSNDKGATWHEGQVVGYDKSSSTDVCAFARSTDPFGPFRVDEYWEFCQVPQE
jgi:hypothetical protein